jgi:hypothetical protein
VLASFASRVSPLLAVEGAGGEESTCVTIDFSRISEGSVKADVVVMPQHWSMGSLPRGVMTRLCKTGFEMPVDSLLVSPLVHPDAAQKSKDRAAKETKQQQQQPSSTPLRGRPTSITSITPGEAAMGRHSDMGSYMVGAGITGGSIGKICCHMHPNPARSPSQPCGAYMCEF